MISHLLKEIIETQRELADSLCTHPVDSFDKYCRLVGIYQGLQQTLERIENLQQQEDN